MFTGHKRQKETLAKAIISGNVSHAFIFEGASGLGKKTLALYLFEMINCREKKEEKPCGHCRECLGIRKGNHPDLILVDPGRKEIQINQIRDIIYKTSLSPYSAPYKWIIINDAHLMNREASNSLLKVLEEPKGNAIFFLISEYPEMLPETVRSRTQRIKFFPLKEKKIVSLLEKIGCPAENAHKIASFSFGRPGVALNFFKKDKKLEMRREKIKELAEITSPQKPFYLRFKYAENFSKDPEALKETLEIWLSYLRGLLLEKIGGGKVKYSFDKIKTSLESIEKTIHLINKTSVNPKLAAEVLLMDL